MPVEQARAEQWALPQPLPCPVQSGQQEQGQNQEQEQGQNQEQQEERRRGTRAASRAVERAQPDLPSADGAVASGSPRRPPAPPPQTGAVGGASYAPREKVRPPASIYPRFLYAPSKDGVDAMLG